MFTVCPDCKRQFRLYAEHIAAAGGQVRCGFCQLQFNALERLFDQPLSSEQLAAVATSRQTTDEPQFDIPEQLADEQDGAAARPVTEAQAQVPASSAGGPENDNEEGETFVLAQPEEVDNETPEDSEAGVADAATSAPRFRFDEDDAVLDDDNDDAGRHVSTLWALGVLSVLLLFALQLGWFHRDRVLRDYPELRPYVQQLCDKLDCTVIRERNTGAITLLNRDVRLHPTYQDTLLVNATMQNELPVRQPYPQVQLTLYDTAGELIGYREFAPTDYLDTSIDIDKGMPVTSPVHFVLEVVGSSDDAVSFEFRFL